MITEGVTPSLHVDYKSSRIKQYHKEGHALRTETTINNTKDFAIGKRLSNLPALRAVGFTATRRLLDVQRLSHDPSIGEERLPPHAAPGSQPPTGRRPRFGDPRAGPPQALLAFAAAGFTHREVRDRLAALLGLDPGAHSRPGHLRPAPAAVARPDRPHARHPTATAPPTRACASPSSSPACMTDSCPPAWRSWPTTTARHPYRQHLAPTTLPWKTSAAQHYWLHKRPIQPKYVKLDSKFRLCRI